jgi:toxin ParE1/3/4
MIAAPIFKPDAAAEAEAAFFWYEDRSPGLGTEFMLALEACLARIQRHPDAFPIAHEGLRRALLRRFPYGVFYLSAGAQVTVYAVFHAKRDPEILTQR